MSAAGTPLSPKSVAASCRWTAWSESALTVELGSGNGVDETVLFQVWALARYLEHHPLPGMKEYQTAYSSLTLFFDPLCVDLEEVGVEVQRIVERLAVPDEPVGRVVEIPVCYCDEFGPDLEFVARHHGLSIAEVIEFHVRGEYLVELIGFAPGFPYLGGLSSRIAVPRLETPRVQVPAGSVGIAGERSGIYPFSMPGGWRLIGRTPVAMFQPDSRPPSRLLAGDRVRFRPIGREAFDAWSGAAPCLST